MLSAAIDEHWAAVCRTLHRLVGDWDEAEDLALQVFYNLSRRPPPAHALKAWLYRAATNAGLNALRDAKRRRAREEDDHRLASLQTAGDDPEATVTLGEQRAAVRAVLAQCKPQWAEALVLRYEGLSYAEIAVALNVSPGSVGTILSRAEQEFERRYRAWEGIHGPLS